jgi:anthranilate phosphoribosyltransferase
MIEQVLAKLADRDDLTVEEMSGGMEAVMSGQCSEAEIAAFLTALRVKGESVAELVGGARVMRRHVTRINAGTSELLDTCGTGGDGLRTFNISTATAIVAAACGVKVAKHGNRGVSSPSGSAEALQSLGVNIEAPVPVVEECLRRVGVGFCYAPLLHPAMRHAMPVRRQLRFRTIFNLLGPLTNPAGAVYQLLGVSRPALAEKLGAALAQLGSRHAYVVCGHDGLDEVTLTGPTYGVEVRGEQVKPIRWVPGDFGLPGCEIAELQVSSAAESADRIRAILDGQPGPARNVVLANSAAALMAAERVDTLRAGVELAAAAIDDGRAKRTLEELARLSHQQA